MKNNFIVYHIYKENRWSHCGDRYRTEGLELNPKPHPKATLCRRCAAALLSEPPADDPSTDAREEEIEC